MGLVERWTRGEVYLEPIEHIYINKNTGEKYTSVTKVLHKLEPPFEAEKIAERITKKKNELKKEEYWDLTKEQILEYWDHLNNEANIYGTNLHEILERYLLANKWYKPANEFERIVINAYNNLNLDEGRVLYPERVMFSKEHKLAGTSDIIIDVDEVYFDVADFKTNKEFNFYNPFGTYLYKPLDFMSACQFSIYTMQLSIYAYMYQLEFPHKKWRQSYLLYWDKELQTFQKINVMYMKDQAKKVLDYHKLQLGV